MALRLVAGFILGLVLTLAAFALKSEAKHNIYLPLVPNTWLMQNVIADGEQTWCVNQSAASYPNFVSQVSDVNEQSEARIGIRHRQIPGVFASASEARNAGCEVWHNGRYDNFCSGCSANVYYALAPVTINYRLGLGYFDWRSTVGHESPGHAVLGLHEMYDDTAGGIGCTRRQDTVMDCGSGVRYPTTLDVERGCAILDPNKQRFTGCGFVPNVPAWGDCYAWGGGVTGCWHPATGTWVGSHGWTYTVATGTWTPYRNDTPWGGYYNAQMDRWVSASGDVFDWVKGWQAHP